jgi:hypothetical protein
LQDNSSGSYRGKTGYVTFEKCWNEVISKEKVSTVNNGEKIHAWFKKHGADMLGKLENEFDCAGLCTP